MRPITIFAKNIKNNNLKTVLFVQYIAYLNVFDEPVVKFPGL